MGDGDLPVSIARTFPLGLSGRPVLKSKARFWSVYDIRVDTLMAAKELGEHTFRLVYELLHLCHINLSALSVLINQVQHIILRNKVSILQFFWASSRHVPRKLTSIDKVPPSTCFSSQAPLSPVLLFLARPFTSGGVFGRPSMPR